MHSLGFGIIAIHSTYMQNKYTPTVRSVYQEICTQIRDGRLPWFAYGRLSEKALVYIQPRWLWVTQHQLQDCSSIHFLAFMLWEQIFSVRYVFQATACLVDTLHLIQTWLLFLRLMQYSGLYCTVQVLFALFGIKSKFSHCRVLDVSGPLSAAIIQVVCVFCFFLFS